MEIHIPPVREDKSVIVGVKFVVLTTICARHIPMESDVTAQVDPAVLVNLGVHDTSKLRRNPDEVCPPMHKRGSQGVS